MKHGDQHVVTGNCIIVWDGITRPETNDSGQLVHSLKLACNPNAPEVAELSALATVALNNDPKFRGKMPPNGCWPISQCDPNKIEGKLAGMVEFSAKTYRGAPQVFDANGQLLNPVTYGPMLYPGAIVQVVVHAYSFDNKSKGVALGLDGIRIIDATAPRLPVGGGIDASTVFGGAAAPGAPAPAYGPPAAAPGAPAPAYGSPAAAPGAPAYGPPAAAPGAPAYGPPAAAPGAPGAPAPAYGPVAPNPGFLQPGQAPPPAPPAGPKMTPAANGVTREAYHAAGWTDQQLIDNGLMTP